MYYRYIHLVVLFLCAYYGAREAAGCFLRGEPSRAAGEPGHDFVACPPTARSSRVSARSSVARGQATLMRS